ncbi:hypothetical protein KIW84_075578 [Lathyrus oleraceus]|uniref:Uncharacterized protein n=1 Tax=Pisum sativum TaxID=3888 RepID=A0A9D4VWV1_PEA|nr:hypothetical protein KIW84_075578 [Pisum sativum]
MEVFNIYVEAFGQEINMTKSEVFFSRNISRPTQEDLACIMGAGKEVMIKSILQTIPSYVMSVFVILDGETRVAFDDKTRGAGNKSFKARYYPNSSFLEAKLGHNLSFAWISVWKTREVLNLGCRWSIDDGSKIKMMFEHWLKGSVDGCLRGPQGRYAYKLTDITRDIVKVPLLKEVIEDCRVWKEEQNGNYSVRTAYRHHQEQKISYEGSVGSASKLGRSYNNTLSRVLHIANRARTLKRMVDTFFGSIIMNQSWQITGLSSIIDPQIHKFIDAKNLILDICNKEDMRTAGRVAVLIWILWNNMNNVIWNNDREAESKLG